MDRRRIGLELSKRDDGNRLVGFWLAAGIAKVPGEHVHFRVHMARGAGNRAVAGTLRVVEKSAALTNDRGGRVVAANRYLAHDGFGGQVNNRNAPRDTIEGIKSRAGPECQASWAAHMTRIRCRAGGSGTKLDSRQ